MKRLEDLNKEFPLTRVQRILLTTDGSITRILEALKGEMVRVETVVQEVVKADGHIAVLLKVPEGEEVNHRAVRLTVGGQGFVYAVSYTPLSRLEDRFKEDIMKRDVPIGRIMADLKIEARREIRDFGVMEADNDVARALGITPGTKILWREYDIISLGEVLLHIKEIFSDKI